VAAGGRGVVVIDAGHGGGDPGCYSRHHGVYEKDITLDIARRLKTVLERQGWKVLMTRETDRDVTYAGSPDKMELQARCDVANDVGADLFISIHCNASASGQGNGTSIHWYKEEDYEFARNLEPMLGEAIGVGNQGLRRDSFYVLRHTSMPAVLVETAYLSHPHDSSRLVQPQVRQLIAERLAGGLVQFMSGRYARAGNYRQQPMR
jgi:N-acetylmuramoyl-L-alanine amidase